jgi:hypothetical protein
MTFDQFYDRLRGKNPGLFDGDSVQISTRSFKAVVRQAFEMGEGNGQARDAAADGAGPWDFLKGRRG